MSRRDDRVSLNDLPSLITELEDIINEENP